MRLATDGDGEEQRYSPSFLDARFPSYEVFWLKHVVPLTGRNSDPPHIRFLSRDELGADRDEDIAIAQLHYTAMRHVGRVHDLLTREQEEVFTYPRPVAEPGPGSAVYAAEAVSAVGPGAATSSKLPHPPKRIRRQVPLDADTFIEAFVRMTGALDVADELLRRHEEPGQYRPWSESDGRRAREEWRNLHGDPLRAIRRYRNRLVHGRVVPALQQREHSWFPRIERVDEHLDWRRAIDDASWPDIAAASSSLTRSCTQHGSELSSTWKRTGAHTYWGLDETDMSTLEAVERRHLESVALGREDGLRRRSGIYTLIARATRKLPSWPRSGCSRR